MKIIFVIFICLLVVGCEVEDNDYDINYDSNWETLPAPVAPDTMLKHDDLYFVNENTGWLVTRNGQIYNTSDGGESWGLQFEDDIYWRCVGFADELHGWAGNKLGDDGKLLYQTNDGGENWSLVDNIPEPVPPGLCGIFVYNSNIINACGRIYGPGVFIRSEDGGSNWNSVDLNDVAEMLIDLYFWDELNGIIVGGTSGGFDDSHAIILGTNDGGVNWEVIYEGERNGEWCWKISFPTPEIGYVSIQSSWWDDAVDEYYLKTTDGGNTWSEHVFYTVAQSAENGGYSSQGIGFINEDVGWMGSYFDHPTLMTLDGGATWSESEFGLHVNRIRFLSKSIGYASGITVYKYTSD